MKQLCLSLKFKWKSFLNKNVLKAKELENEINALLFRVIEEHIQLWIAIFIILMMIYLEWHSQKLEQ